MNITVALAALQAAADPIRAQPGIEAVNADYVHKSGEILFTVQGGQSYTLQLQESSDEEG